MKTTLDLDTTVLRQAKQRAAAAGTTLKAYVEDALRAGMAPRHEKRRSFKFRPPLITGKIPPAVDVADRDALYDFMEARH